MTETVKVFKFSGTSLGSEHFSRSLQCPQHPPETEVSKTEHRVPRNVDMQVGCCH